MLSKIKEIVTGNEAKAAVAELVEQVKLASATIKQQSELIDSLKKETEAAKALIADVVSESKNSVDAARQLQDELKKDISELKALSTHIQSSIKQKISEDLSELAREVKGKLEGSERLKNEVSAAASAVNAELSRLKEDVSKLAAVAGKIKAEDFELSKFSQQLASADKEKLQLMAKIDSLEHLISKMRRQG